MIAVTSRQLKFKSHRVPIPSIMNEKKILNLCLFLKQKEKQNQIMKL